jgi:hypothetical protein
MLPRFLLFAVLCSLSTVTSGREIYVDNVAGNDGFTGTQRRNVGDVTGPVRSIAKALRMAQPGDHLVLAAHEEPYRESITLIGARHSGSPQFPTVIQGEGATLDGSRPVPPKAWVFVRDNVFRYRPPAMGAHQQFFLDGKPAVRVTSGRLGAAVPKLAPRQWCLHEGEIYFAVEPDKLPADYALTCSSLVAGILLHDVEHVGIVDLTVTGYQLDGIQATSGARSVYLSAVTCRGNGRSGVSVGGAAQLELRSCTLSGNGFAQLLTMPYSDTHIFQSRLAKDTAPGWVEQGGTVYLGVKRATGGREQILPEDCPQPPAPKAPHAEPNAVAPPADARPIAPSAAGGIAP